MDNLTKEQRRRNMQNVRSKDTKIEVLLRKALWHKGYRYRKNYSKLPGRPDIVLTKYRIAIFCDSEFFHGKDWQVLEERIKRGDNSEYWLAKIRRNMERDREVEQQLRFEEWTVIRFWGREIICGLEECIRVIEEVILDQRLAAIESEDTF